LKPPGLENYNAGVVGEEKEIKAKGRSKGKELTFPEHATIVGWVPLVTTVSLDLFVSLG